MKTITYFLLIAFFLSIHHGCKKGEDDPLLSLRTRTERLSGEWVLYDGVEWKGNEVINYDGETAIMGNQQWNYSESLKFTSGGKYECIIESDKYSEKSEKRGSWVFGSKDEIMDLKSKEYIVIRVKEYKYYYTTGQNSVSLAEVAYAEDACPLEMLRLKELSFDEITIEMQGNIVGHYGNNDSSYVASYTKSYERK